MSQVRTGLVRLGLNHLIMSAVSSATSNGQLRNRNGGAQPAKVTPTDEGKKADELLDKHDT